MRFEGKRFVLGCITAIVLIVIAGSFIYELSPANANASSMVFEIKQGEGFRTIIQDLRNDNLVRSKNFTEVFSIFDGTAFSMQPGLYKLSAAMSVPTILDTISTKGGQDVTVTIPEGSNIYQIDGILADNLVIHRGELINFKDDGNLEGRLFPDTYDFFTDSNVKDVVQKFLDNFNAKAQPLLNQDLKNATSDLIIASMVEKEVPDPADQKIVAGIMYKRIKTGIYLDVDATVCYIKYQQNPTSTAGCLPLDPSDYQSKSAYNTYNHMGLPPGPIGNPGITALEAAIAPSSSPYLYYLSDPSTGQTIFAKTLDEQNANRVKYLKAN